MNYKPKIKYKLRAAIMAALSGLSLALTTISASAWEGTNAGAINGANFTEYNTPYGYFEGSDQFAWRVNMYVSANPDGKINKDTDVVGSTALPLVGSLLCTGDKWVTATVGDTYIQTNYTDTERTSFSPSGVTPGTLSYTLPTLQKFNPLYDTYYSYTPDGTPQTVAIAKSGSIQLFRGQYNTKLDFSTINSMLTGDKADEYTAEILEQIRDKDKGNDKTPGFLLRTLSSISPQIQQAIPEKAKLEGLNQTDAINKYILPNGEEPMVEWAMVITPLFRFECKVPFYCYDATGKEAQFGSPSSNVNAALDAFWFAQYNQTTKALSNTGKHFPGNYTNRKGELCAIAQPYQGMLAFWLQNSAGKPANAAYCLKDKDPYLGVYTNVTNNTTLNSWWTLLKTMPSEYAKRGGISVFTTKIEAPTPKIYYHLYTYELDEQNPPAGYTVGTTYAPKDLLKFTPNLGTPTVTSFSRDYAPTDTEYYYIPASDPKATENNNVPVAAMTPQPTVTINHDKPEYPALLTRDAYLQKYPGTVPDPEHITTPLTAFVSTFS